MTVLALFRLFKKWLANVQCVKLRSSERHFLAVTVCDSKAGVYWKSQLVNKVPTVLLSSFTSLITLQDSTTVATPHYVDLYVNMCDRSQLRNPPNTLLFQGVSSWNFIPVPFIFSLCLSNTRKDKPGLCVSACVCTDVWSPHVAFLSSLSDIRGHSAELRRGTLLSRLTEQ